MGTIRELGERGIVLRSLREGIDTSNAAGRMVASVLASLAELELELGRERRTAAREARSGRSKALDTGKVGVGAADACQRRVGHHDCVGLRGESSDGLSRARRSA
jgi:DNA invertase Pin-like site-specific DNA recombinase